MLLVWSVLCALIGLLTVLAATPQSRRERRLRRHGRTATAICREHLNGKYGEGPMRVRCGFRLTPDGCEYRAVVGTRERIPQVGEQVRIVYDPQDPRIAENLELTASVSFGRDDLIALTIWVLFYLVTTGCMTAAG